jgi:hypothetical protein
LFLKITPQPIPSNRRAQVDLAQMFGGIKLPHSSTCTRI